MDSKKLCHAFLIALDTSSSQFNFESNWTPSLLIVEINSFLSNLSYCETVFVWLGL